MSTAESFTNSDWILCYLLTPLLTIIPIVPKHIALNLPDSSEIPPPCSRRRVSLLRCSSEVSELLCTLRLICVNLTHKEVE